MSGRLFHNFSITLHVIYVQACLSIAVSRLPWSRREAWRARPAALGDLRLFRREHLAKLAWMNWMRLARATVHALWKNVRYLASVNDLVGLHRIVIVVFRCVPLQNLFTWESHIVGVTNVCVPGDAAIEAYRNVAVFVRQNSALDPTSKLWMWPTNEERKRKR